MVLLCCHAGLLLWGALKGRYPKASGDDGGDGSDGSDGEYSLVRSLIESSICVAYICAFGSMRDRFGARVGSDCNCVWGAGADNDVDVGPVAGAGCEFGSRGLT